LFALDYRVRSWLKEGNASFDRFFFTLFSRSVIDTARVLESEAALHNKVMHAYNGNPTFSAGMKNVIDSASILGFTSSASGPVLDIAGFAQHFVSRGDTSRPGPGFMSCQEAMLYNIVTPGNFIEQKMTVRFPNTD
jgi:hypothetical protein